MSGYSAAVYYLLNPQTLSLEEQGRFIFHNDLYYLLVNITKELEGSNGLLKIHFLF